MSDDIHALSGAYAVDAVDDIERAMFERHLAQCGSCRAEVDSLREAGALIAETSSQMPPAALRGRVLAGIEAIRPLPPVFTATERSRRRRFPALVAAAAAFVVIGAAGATVVHPWSDDSAPISAQRLQDAPDVEVIHKALGDGVSMTITRSKKLNQALVSTDGLAPLADNQTYEIWLIHDKTMVKAGLMDGDASSILLEGDPSTATAAGITIEPAGGSTTPSNNLVAIVPFKQA
ncbi:anti-sigma factor [soil metagenome]